jgi:cytochrome o ubiquinol oxidase subunit II
MPTHALCRDKARACQSARERKLLLVRDAVNTVTKSSSGCKLKRMKIMRRPTSLLNMVRKAVPVRTWCARADRWHSLNAVKPSAAVAATLSLSGCGFGILDPQGPIGAAEKTILLNALFIMLAIIIPTVAATLWFAFWFRSGNAKALYRPQWVYSGRIELVIWSIPLLTITFLGGIIWIGSHELDPARPLASEIRPLEVQVVSLDWKWLFIYPEHGVASVNQVVVPIATPVHFSLTSASVMNAFFVPQLGSMIYTMNGMTTQLYLQADRMGDFYGRSSHFSGDGFPAMEFTLRAVSNDAFNDWARGIHGGGGMLDANAYAELAERSMNVKPFTYGSIDPNLFHAIVTQAIPPAPGPRGRDPAPDGSTRPGE